MSHPPALSWTCLLPSGTRFQCEGLPPWLTETLASSGGGAGPEVLVASSAAACQGRDLSSFAGAVISDARENLTPFLRGSGMQSVRRYAVLPNWKHSRFFVPLASPAVAVSSLDLYQPLRWGARLWHRAVRTAARAGWWSCFPDQIWIALRDPGPLETLFSQLFPATTVDVSPQSASAIQLAIASGNVATVRNRKLTLAVLGPAGQKLGFAKRSLGDLSRAAVAREAHMLAALAATANGPCVAPRSLHFGELDGALLHLTSPLAGRTPGSRWTNAHEQLLARLRSGQEMPVRDMAFVRTLRERVHHAADQVALPGTAHLSGALAQALDRLDATRLPAGIVHRDFAPWNLRRHGGQLAAFDWEYAELEGPPLVDATHHELAVAYFVDRCDPETACQRLLRRAAAQLLGLLPEQTHALQIIYLVDHLLLLIDEGYPPTYPKRVWWDAVLRKLVARTGLQGAEESAGATTSLATVAVGSEQDEGRTSAANPLGVLQMLRTGTPGAWSVLPLCRGGQAEIFCVRPPLGTPRTQLAGAIADELILKVFDPEKPEIARAFQDELASLRILQAVVHGREFHGWRLLSPAPLEWCERPRMLLLSRVPGVPLHQLLRIPKALSDATCLSISQAVAAALLAFWEAEGRIYGDLRFHNILCDPSQRQLALLDCGMPEQYWLCEEVERRFFPASRDLAYLAYSVAAGLKASLLQPAARTREEWLCRQIIAGVLERCTTAQESLALVREIRACAQVHLDRLRISLSPSGSWRLVVKRSATRSLVRILRPFEAAAEPGFDHVKPSEPWEMAR